MKKIILLFTSLSLLVAASLVAQSGTPSDATDTTVTQTYTTRAYDTSSNPYPGTIPVSITWTAVPLNNTDGASQYNVTVAIKNSQSSTCLNWVLSLERATDDTVVSVDSSVDHGSFSSYFLSPSLTFLQSAGYRNIDADDSFSFTYVIALNDGVTKPTPPNWMNFTWQQNLNSPSTSAITIYSDDPSVKIFGQ
jgi:hypothetical protein